jgi:NAD(P) transhydrogenase subunit alpha
VDRLLVPLFALIDAQAAAAGQEHVTSTLSAEVIIGGLYVFALAAFLGYQVISRVPPLLHTPLMSATNAISGISLVGSIVTAGAQYTTLSTILGFVAVTAATINVVGGFMITDRMLRMFKQRPTPGKEIEGKERRQG